MEKRFVLFIMLAISVLVTHSLIMSYLYPPKPRPPVAEAPGDDPEPPKEGEGDPPEEGAEQPKEGPAAKPPPEIDKAKPRPAIKAQWAVLGDFDGSVSPLLVYLTNQGGAVDRIELVERTAAGKLRYRDLDYAGGYLGYLSLEDTPESRGCVVNVVAPGTPAAKAIGAGEVGLKPGDIIVAFNDATVASRADLEALAAETKPGQEVDVEVLRQDDGKEVKKRFSVTMASQPLAVVSSERLLGGAIAGHPDSFLSSIHSISSGGATVQPKRNQVEIPGLPSLREGHWKMVADDRSVELTFALSASELSQIGVTAELEIVKRFRLPAADAPHKYHLDFELGARNKGTTPVDIAFRMDGPNGLPTEGWWYLRKVHPGWGSCGARDVVWTSEMSGHELRSVNQIWKRSKDEKSPTDPFFTEKDDSLRRSVGYMGVDTQYFAVSISAAGYADGDLMHLREATPVLLNGPGVITKRNVELGNVSFYSIGEPQSFEANSEQVSKFTIFAGPKRPDVLNAYGLSELIVWGWFAFIAWPLSLLLHFFNAMFGNFGVAIILLTILVRASMFPISRKAQKNAQMMQQLAPEMKKINEKHKNDSQKKIEAQQELYRRHNFNPFGGCLLMFLQIPVFIGLYRCLSVDIALRQAPLIPGLDWCPNLAGPDMLWMWGAESWPFITGFKGWLGPYFNVLPILTVVLFLAQQKLYTPPPTDEQQRMSQQMMKYFTFFIGVMFYKVASGLCLYFIISSLWGLVERKMIPKPNLGGDAASGNGDPVKPAPTPARPSQKKKKRKRR